MPGTKVSFDTVRKIGLALPEVEEGTAYGSPALKVRGSLLACVPGCWRMPRRPITAQITTSTIPSCS
jgi:hypothetical protein